MSGVSEQQLAEIAARAEAASAGPWNAMVIDADTATIWAGGDTARTAIRIGRIANPEDAAFVVAAREDVPALLAEVARGRALWADVARIAWSRTAEAKGRARYGKQLEARIAELEAERHSTNEALSEAAEAIREKDARLAAVRDAVAEAFMCPDEDCDGHLPKLEQILGGLDLLREAEAGGSRG